MATIGNINGGGNSGWLFAAPDVSVTLAANLAASSGVSAALEKRVLLFSSFAGQATVTASLRVVAPVNLAASLSAGAAVIAGLAVDKLLAASFGASAVLAADINALSVSFSGSALLSGGLAQTISLGATLGAKSKTLAGLSVAIGCVDGGGNTGWTFATVRDVQAAMVATSSLSAALYRPARLAMQAGARSSITASLSSPARLACVLRSRATLRLMSGRAVHNQLFFGSNF